MVLVAMRALCMYYWRTSTANAGARQILGEGKVLSANYTITGAEGRAGEPVERSPQGETSGRARQLYSTKGEPAWIRATALMDDEAWRLGQAGLRASMEHGAGSMEPDVMSCHRLTPIRRKR